MLKIIICNYIKLNFNKEITKKDIKWNNKNKYKTIILATKLIIKIKIGIPNLIFIRKNIIMVTITDKIIIIILILIIRIIEIVSNNNLNLIKIKIIK